MNKPKFMPVHPDAKRGDGFPEIRMVPFWALHEGNAQRVHDQTLDELARRGGLDWVELWGNMLRVNALLVTCPTPQQCAWFVHGFVQGRAPREGT